MQIGDRFLIDGKEITLINRASGFHPELGWVDQYNTIWHEDQLRGHEVGRKDDQTKPPLHLIAPDFLFALAEILDFGQKKYAPRNWEKGMGWSRVYRAAVGHLLLWFMREEADPETGKSHLWHAACCVMFLVCYELRHVGEDDRPQV